MYAALYARAPVVITDAMANAYDARVRDVDARYGASLRAAFGEYRDAEARARQSTPFMWRLTTSGEERAGVERARREAREALRALRKEEKSRDAAMREARSELGLWSDLGVGDAKALFKKKYEGGKIFATRQTFWDGLSLMLRGKSDESTVSFLLRWMMIALSNFTVGMIFAIFGFAFALPRVIASFSVSIWSAVAFYVVALVAAVAIVASVLVATYGGAAGTAYVLVKHVGPTLARIDDGADRRRRRIDGRAYRRPHAD